MEKLSQGNSGIGKNKKNKTKKQLFLIFYFLFFLKKNKKLFQLKIKKCLIVLIFKQNISSTPFSFSRLHFHFLDSIFIFSTPFSFSRVHLLSNCY